MVFYYHHRSQNTPISGETIRETERRDGEHPLRSRLKKEDGEMTSLLRLAAPVLLMGALSEGFLPASRRPFPALAGLRRAEQQLVQQSARPRSSWVVVLSAAAEENDVAEAKEEVQGEEAVEEKAVSEEAAGEGAAEGDAEGGEAEGEEEEEEEPAEDPELVALKEELSSLEKTVIETKKSLSAEKDKVVEAGQTGYLRLAANVENYKRRTKESKKDSEGIAMLAVTKAFFGKKSDNEGSVMEVSEFVSPRSAKSVVEFVS